jgi:hypothetical protein
MVRAGPRSSIKEGPSSPPFHSASRCKGNTRSGEDLSELVFLLVENYPLTTSVGLRFSREFLANPLYETLFSLMVSLASGTLKKIDF